MCSEYVSQYEGPSPGFHGKGGAGGSNAGTNADDGSDGVACHNRAGHGHTDKNPEQGSRKRLGARTFQQRQLFARP
jgi:hypothetical protein